MSITWLSSVSSFWVFWASSVGWHPVWPPRWLTVCSRSLTPWSSRTGALGRWDSAGRSSGTYCFPCVTWLSSSYTVLLCSQHLTVLLCLTIEMIVNHLDRSKVWLQLFKNCICTGTCTKNVKIFLDKCFICLWKFRHPCKL